VPNRTGRSRALNFSVLLFFLTLKDAFFAARFKKKHARRVPSLCGAIVIASERCFHF
jgi:hypothetical protein